MDALTMFSALGREVKHVLHGTREFTTGSEREFSTRFESPEEMRRMKRKARRENTNTGLLNLSSDGLLSRKKTYLLRMPSILLLIKTSLSAIMRKRRFRFTNDGLRKLHIKKKYLK